jgi:hypothetical protein
MYIILAQIYVTYPQGRFYTRSKWPTITFNHLKVLPNVPGSDTDMISHRLGVRKADIKLALKFRMLKKH